MKSPKDTKHQNLELRLLDVIDQYRATILDPIEQELGNSPNWKYLRSRILKAFGDRGLSLRIREILDSEFLRSEVLDD